MKYISYYNSPLGKIMLTSDGEAVTGAWFEGEPEFEPDRNKNVTSKKEIPVLREARAWLDMYFSGKNPGKISLIRLEGTKFQKRVWAVLFQIPYGKTMTYGAIAKEIMKETGQKKMSAQAVGGAVGRNPVSLFCPCHRVIGAGGKLTGYAGGVDKKRALLALEKADMTGCFVPSKKYKAVK